jgi:hypothetical protein
MCLAIILVAYALQASYLGLILQLMILLGAFFHFLILFASRLGGNFGAP